MKMKELMTDLWSNTPVEGVRKFNTHIASCEDKKGFIKYFFKYSWCSEILRPFGKPSIKYGQLKAIVECLTAVLTNLSLDVDKHKEVALKITVHLLEKKGARMQELLMDGRADRIKTGLKCLKAMACTGGEQACKVIEFLAKPHECFSKIAKHFDNTVRECYIELLFYFLTSDNPHILDQFLMKPEVLLSIFPGLRYKQSEEVLLILNSLYKHILMNPNVTKKRKILMFTPETVRHLKNLYSWVGPRKKLPKSKDETELPKSKDETELPKSEDKTDNENEEAGKEITRTVFKFILTLCSSHEHGLVMRSSGFRRSGHNLNSSIYKIISDMNKPWETTDGVLLMSHAFAACPELLPKYLDSLKNLLFPRSSVAFVSLMEMLVEIVKLQKPWQLMESQKWQSVVSCIFPGFPLNQNFYLRLCQSEHRTVRYVGCTLMLAVLRKTKETKEELKKLGLPNDVLEKVEQKFTKEVSNTFGKQILNSLTDCWKYTINSTCSNRSEEEENPKIEEGDVNIQLTDEILIIAEFLNHYSDILASPVVEVLCPLDVLNTILYVSSLKSEELTRSRSAKKDFWVACLDLLYKIISQKKFTVGVENLEENIYHAIIKTNSHFLRSSEFTSYCTRENKDVKYNLEDVLSVALDKTGITDDAENIRYWLKHITGPNYVKLSTFLTHIIQQTVRSYNHYTDYLIELKEKFTKQGSLPFLVDVEPVIFDNKQVPVILGYNKPFSRFVLAAVDLLTANPDDEYKQYFSSVLSDCIHSMYNPGLLVLFLIEKISLISDDLKTYLWHFVSHPELPKNESREVLEEADLTKVLKMSFMAQDFTSLNALLDTENIQYAVRGNMRLIVLQILLYLFVERERANVKVIPVSKTYAEILKKLYVASDEENGVVVIKTVLEHPRVLKVFTPAGSNKSPITSLTQYFIGTVFEKYPDVSLYTYPYYLKMLSSLKSASKKGPFVRISSGLSPFVNSENTILSYDDVEELCLVCLKLPGNLSTSCSPVLYQLVSILQSVTTPRKQPQEETVHLLFNKYLEWTVSKKGGKHKSRNKLLVVMEDFLPRIMTTKIAQQITHGELQRLLHWGPRSADICCQLIKLHHPHGVYFASRIKENIETIPDQAQLISVLLGCEESNNIVREVLPKLHERVKEWSLTVTDGSEYFEELFLECLKAGVFDSGDLIDIYRKTYELTDKKVLPRRKLTYLLPVYKKINENPVSMSKLPFKDSGVCLLHILLNVMRAGYKKGGKNTALMLSCCHLVETVLPEVDSDLLKVSFAQNKFWFFLVKQVLRHGLIDVKAGPVMINSLVILIRAMYINLYQVDVMESHNDLSLYTIYQMIISHTQYLPLMFQREAEWDKLKESIVELQQTIIDHNKSICLEEHVPVLLGAYGASMSAVDQKILRLLHIYEEIGAMNRYNPLLWGDAAVAHFGLFTSTKTYEEPKSNQIIGLLKGDKMFKTCCSFDVNLPLEPGDVYGDDRTIYDMRFLLPLMLHLSEDENLLEIDFAESGAVAVGFTCLSSHQKDIWAAGATILKRVVDKMNKSRHVRFKLPWQWVITIVVSSFDGKELRLPSVVLHFLLLATRLLSCPQDPMYFIILKSIFIRPTLDLVRVPQFNRLYTSEDVFDNRVHMLFLLNFLSTGVRFPEDFYICDKTAATPTLIISLLQSPTADYEIREQTLKVLESIVSIPVGAHDLVNKYHILMMLPMALKLTSSQSVEDDDCVSAGLASVTAAVVRVLAAIWSSMITVKDTVTCLSNRLLLNPTVKRKRDEDKDGSSDASSSDDEDSDEGPALKKLKSGDSSIDTTEKTSESKTKETKTSSDSQENRVKRLQPLFVEDYMNCLLCIATDVINYASPEYAAKYIGLVSCALDHLLKSSLREVETLHTVAQNPDVVKERVYSAFPWEPLQKCLEDTLTESELVRILGSRVEECMQAWKKEPLSEQLKQKQNADCKSESSLEQKKSALNLLELKTSAFNLLSLLGK
ncbi:nucleolar pre-ribosomal-associated protein 1-like [Macrobrachium nipponense]|uniref:nucleolar pre-ribosomal-associated protein 1-like n=1 Tax=Macrobrachium nipponense TaxID=159736 RepID=UPI0030C7D0ED